MRFLPRRLTGPVWDCPSAVPSLHRMTAACGPPTTLRAAQVFTSFCPPESKKSAVDDVKLGNITALLKNFQPALATLTKADGHRDSHNDPLVQKVAEASARLTAASLTKRSPIIKELADAKQLEIAAAMHDITTGKVTWLA